jgi:hypothetical protein
MDHLQDFSVFPSGGGSMVIGHQGLVPVGGGGIGVAHAGQGSPSTRRWVSGP